MTVSLTTTNTPLFFEVKDAVYMCGKRMCLQVGVAVVAKCVSCIHRMSQLVSWAVFQSECPLAGCLRPLAFRDRTVTVICDVVFVTQAVTSTYS